MVNSRTFPGREHPYFFTIAGPRDFRNTMPETLLLSFMLRLFALPEQGSRWHPKTVPVRPEHRRPLAAAASWCRLSRVWPASPMAQFLLPMRSRIITLTNPFIS
jgi:hypothetical protein